MDVTRYLTTKSLQVLKFVGFLAVYLIAESVFEIASTYIKDPLAARHVLGLSLVIIAGSLALLGWRYGKQLQANNPRQIGKKANQQTNCSAALDLYPHDGYPGYLAMADLQAYSYNSQ